MDENPNQLREDDAVGGGQNLAPAGAVVLGGIEGVKRRLASTEVKARIAALSEALKYGEVGLDLVIQALDRDSSAQIQSAAYLLLTERQEPKVKARLRNYLPWFEFETVTVNRQGKIISREIKQARYFTEDLGLGVTLEMVAIPGGKFLMGSSESEQKRWKIEEPQHLVSVKPFFMGKFQITQAQWRAIASLPKVKRDLNPAPSKFKGNDRRPVECVNWYDAVEFCARLSNLTGREYRLPSEAEWEYACRAGTTTPFYFGETITTDLANYRGTDFECKGKTDSGFYGDAPIGVYRRETTPVGQFSPNAFGLYDMHGNVWEWCADTWHDNYYGASTGGTAGTRGGFWTIAGAGDDNHSSLRGGSWLVGPQLCRSASRVISVRVRRDPNNHDGFRLACGAGRT